MSMKSPFHYRYFNSRTSTFFFFFSSVIIFLLFFFTSVNNVVAATDDDTDYMLRLFEAFTPKPPGWSNNTHFCKWDGVVCTETTSRVQIIKLPSMSLKGELPPDLHTLSNLTHLDLHNNSLTGTLPILTTQDALETVLLGHNSFTSIHDDSFEMMTSFKTFNISNNLNINRWLFPIGLVSSSPLLHTLDLEATNIIGPFPDIFEWPPSLETLVLSHNNFTGPLPDSLGKSVIKCLKLNNQGVPNGSTDSIKVISSMKFLSQVWLNNSFSGHFPDFSNSTHLFDLRLHSNRFGGVVPPSLMALSSLKKVSLDDNKLQGPIPEFPTGVNATYERNSFCRKDHGPCDPRVTILLEVYESFLAIFSGVWVGNDPCGLEWQFISCEGEKIVAIDMSNLTLGGTISPAFANLTELVNLTLPGNYLTGPIPLSLTRLSHLRLLDVSNNNLSGPIPKFSPDVNLITIGNVLLRDQSKSSYATPWIIGASVFCIIVAILIVTICKHKSYFSLVQKKIFKKTTTLLDDNVEDFIKSYNLSVPKRYSYAEVKKITNSFREKLGQGGYGIVYKGMLPDGRQVAVKLIKESKGDGEEFINEVASISRTLHVNIVSLLGFCYEKNKRTLIYEFMPNGSLDKFIYRSGVPSAICNLDWNTLNKIVIGIARGLEYLHEGCISRILHLDIKPQNILLDEDFCPKICDFGLAKICQKKDSIVSMLGTRGTIGYIAPEVFSRSFGGVSHKCYVYSYGMLILEMIGGRKNYDTGGSHTSEMFFPDWIYKDLEQSKNLGNSLAMSEDENDMVKKIAIVSLWCIQTNPLERPSMSKVMEMLQAPLHSLPYPPKPVLYSPERLSILTSDASSSSSLKTNSTMKM